MMQVKTNEQVSATRKVLYAEYPQQVGDCFIEIREWSTANGDHVELIVEFGQMDLSGDVVTQCKVMPFFMTVREVLQEIGQ